MWYRLVTRAFIILVGATFAIAGPARANVVITTIGSPLFVPADFHLFSAPIGTFADNFAEFGQTIQRLLPPPNHLFDPNVGSVPGQPHAGPYTTEIGQGLAAAGFKQGTTFSVQDISNGNGINWAFMAVPGPGAPTGRSPDGSSGPIIPNVIFPIHFDEKTLTQGAVVDTSTADYGDTTSAGIFGPNGQTLDGYSHLPLFLADNFEFILANPGGAQYAVPGTFEYRGTYLDKNGNGFSISATFDIAVPEPPAWSLMIPGVLVLGVPLLRRSFCRSGPLVDRI